MSDKKFYFYLRAFGKFPGDFRDLIFSQNLSTTSYSSYLSSFFFQKKQIKNPSTPSTLRVPPTGGTLSFNEKNIWILEMEKIPARYRGGIIKYLDRNRSSIFLCSIFNPRTFSFDLAEKSDFYFIKKKSWIPAIRQLKDFAFPSIVKESMIPKFSPKLSLKEKLAIRMLWKFRQRFIRLEELSSYLYGRRMPKNLHASETTILELRDRLKKITGRENIINCCRKYGYRIKQDAWKDIIEQ